MSSPAPTDLPQQLIIHFTFWDKILIMASVALFFAVLVLFLICILYPDCALYRFCHFNDRKYSGFQQVQHHVYGTLEPPVLMMDGKTIQPEKVSPINDRKRQMSQESDISTPDLILLKKPRERSGSASSLPSDTSFGTATELQGGCVDIALTMEKEYKRIKIRVIQVRDLNLGEMAEIVSPYIRIRLYRAPKQFFPFRGPVWKDVEINNLDVELKTRIQKPADTLTFNESFSVDIDPDDLKNYSLKFQLCDLDKFARHIVLGEKSVFLKRPDLLDQKEVKITEELKPPHEEDIGEIYLALSYLPTAEKLSLTVFKMRGLKAMDKKLGTTDACVKVSLMKDGRQLKKAKTDIRRADLNPTFNETFIFDVPQYETDNVYFIVTVVHATEKKRAGVLIGRSYLGLNFDTVAREHWMEMMENTRRQVATWHKLRC